MSTMVVHESEDDHGKDEVKLYTQEENKTEEEDMLNIRQIRFMSRDTFSYTLINYIHLG